LKISKSLENFELEDEDENIAVDIVRDAIQYPVIQISNNAGYKGDRVVEQVKADKNLNTGFDASTGDFKDLVKA
jgi:chaperonin GroEL